MQVDEEEEKPSEAEPDITLENTKTQLKREGPIYAEEHSKRVFEERLAGKHKVEDLTAKLQTLLKHKDEQKAAITADTQKIIPEIIDGKMTELTKLIEKNKAESNKGPNENMRRTNEMLIIRLDKIDKDIKDNDKETKQSKRSLEDIIANLVAQGAKQIANLAEQVSKLTENTNKHFEEASKKAKEASKQSYKARRTNHANVKHTCRPWNKDPRYRGK